VVRTTAAADGDGVATAGQVVEAVPKMVDQQNVHPRQHCWWTTAITAEQAQIARRCFHRCA